MAEPLHAVKHYQKVLERSQHDQKRMLRCIEKLYHLPVTVQLLQDTGVGRTVNALRKGEGEVATAARTVIAKWKQMVADEEEELENQQAEYNENHQSSPPPSNDNDRVSEKSYRSSSSRHDRDESSMIKVNDDYKKSAMHREAEENELRQREQKREKQRIEEKQNKKIKYSREKEYERRAHSPKHESPNSSEDNDSEEEDSEVKENENDRVEHVSDNDYTSGREERANQRSLSDDESEPESPPVKQSSHKPSKSSNSHSSSSSKSKHSHHNDKSEKHKSKHKLSGNDSSSSKSSSRDRGEKSKSTDDSNKKASDSHDKHSRGNSSQMVDLHRKYEKLDEKERLLEKERISSSKERRPKESDKLEKDNRSSSKSKHSSSSKDSHSHHSDRSKHHKDKHSDKDRHNSEKSKKSSDKHKSTSHQETSVKKDARDSSESRKKESKDDSKRERSKQSLPKENTSSKSDLKQKHQESPEGASDSKKRKVYNQTGDGIDGGSGASFAEALGMISPSKSSISSKKKPSSSSKMMSESSESPSDTSYKQSYKEEATPSLLQNSSKLVPLAPLTVSISALPDISPNYVPRPPPKLIDNPFPSISEEEALNVVMNTKNQRTKVFSGNKTAHGCIPSLYELCVIVLQENINALEYTGGVPYEIIKPVVDKATPDQLFTLEHFNPYLIEDTDPLWQIHCNKRFRNKQRQEMESWREMYMRCCDEQEAKLKSLTANIKLAQDAKALPVRQTKMAYVDSIVKPPRNIARKQAIHGTARKAVASPAARVAALANSTVFNAASAIGAGASSSTQPVRTSSFIKPKKAPLMQKALQLIKGRYKR